MTVRKRTAYEYTLLGTCGLLCLVITPFTTIRFIVGDYALAFLDLGLIAGMLCICIYVFKTGQTKIPSYIAAGAFVFGATCTVHLRGIEQIHWAYPALVIIFYFLRPKLALLLSGISIAVILPAIEPFTATLNALKIFSTLTVNVVCAYIFASVTRKQQIELQNLTKKDPLTKIGNRSAMDTAISEAFEAHKNASSPVSALMIDIDHFKDINDQHGHHMGDMILVKTAELIDNNVRTSESVYRYGGEEFVVIARDMPPEDAVQLAERLRLRISNYIFDNGIKITISVGVTEVNDADNTRQWLHRADQALYHAKESGRNRVVHFNLKTSS